jgi:hypothetical protein
MAAWTPTLAVAGADYYGHTSLPEWNHSILVTSLKSSRLVSLKLSDDGRSVEHETQYFQNWFGRLRDLCVSPNGDVYLAISNRDGRGTIRPGDDRIVKISAQESSTGLEAKPGGRDEDLSIYPNPLNGGEFTLEYTPSERAVLTVYNETGVKILSREIYPDQSRTKISLPDSGGLYLLRIREGNLIVNRKLIKL